MVLALTDRGGVRDRESEGFGIGDLLTPVLAVRVGTNLAVDDVSLPHLAATILGLLLLPSAR